ncbi:MAG: DEAD/DEAH box helicase [Bacteroidales bacterium]|nr:DEAD/DEAH box helicase [Bacteroidales bacterium]
MQQLQAGYFLNGIFDLFVNPAEKEKISKIVEQLCYFDLETEAELKHIDFKYAPETKIINNLITRGLPTNPSLFIEEMLSTSFAHAEKIHDKYKSIKYQFNKIDLTDEIYRAIHIIDPRINKENQFSDTKNEVFKDYFRNNIHQLILPEYLGEAFIQLIDTQRTYASIAGEGRKLLQADFKEKFKEILQKKADFSIEMPYKINNVKGITIEIDDTPVETGYDFEIEQLKTTFTGEIGWDIPFKINTDDFSNSSDELRPVINFTYNPYFDTLGKNYRSPLYKSKDGLDALQLALSPIAVARIQKTIIEYILSGILKFSANTWNIGIIERDVPCAYLAIQDLKLQFNKLFALKGENKQLPEINLSIYRTKEFKNTKLNTIYPGNIQNIDNFDEEQEFDLLIDISVLQRSGLKNKPYNTQAKNKAVIRSVHYISSRRKLLTDKLIRYHNIKSGVKSDKKTDKAREALKHFLRNIFRKENFLPGQLDLLQKNLQLNNTLGLLPSGGGKSIVYQLSAFLQPGYSLIISPLMSVMQDQIQALKSAGIDTINYINASVKSQNEIDEKYQSIENGEALFVFTEAEYMRHKQMQKVLSNLSDKDIFPAYFIVDEAHCLSEWSHDFRPEYHKLGELSKKLLIPKNLRFTPIQALSATASYNVRWDIYEELFIDEENTIFTNFNEQKLNFKLIDVSSNSIKPEMPLKQAKYLSGSRKQVHFSFLMEELFPKGTSKGQENATVIFCPEPYGETGISDEKGDGLADKMEANFDKLRIGKFLGASNDGTDSVPVSLAELSEHNHQKFIINQIDILIATKAFGIGVSKPDIRNIIYFNLPASVESFIQQSFRAGNNDKETSCSVLIDKQLINIPEDSLLKKYFAYDKINIDKYFALNSLLKTYRGKQKELTQINNLLEASDDSPTYLEIIRKLFKNEYNQNIELRFQPENNPSRLYVDADEDKTYGYIDLKTLVIRYGETAFDTQKSIKRLNFVLEELKKRCKNNDIVRCLQKERKPAQPAGIKYLLDSLKIKEAATYYLSFDNAAIDEIAALLQKYISPVFSPEIIANIYRESNSFESFYNELNELNLIGIKTSKINIKQEVEKLYYKIRSKTETFISLYRLSKLGIIEDFTINPLEYRFELKIKKKSPEIYLLNQNNIVKQFILQDKYEEIKQKNTDFSTDVLKNALQAHVNYVYDLILPERIKSLNILWQNLESLEKSKNKSISQHHLNEYFSNYFTARYSNQEFSAIEGSPSLNAQNQDFNIIKDYIKNIGHYADNWKHLKKSTDLIAEHYPENYLSFLLSAFAELISGTEDENKIEAALDQISRGFIRMRQKQDFEYEWYLNQIKSFLDYLYENRSDLKEKYEPVMWLRIHAVWMQDFNKRFLKKVI